MGTKLYLSPKVSDACLSFKDGPNGGYVRWKCVWKNGFKTAVASEWIPVRHQKVIEYLINKINKERAELKGS